MADCFSLPNAAKIVNELEYLLSLKDEDLASLVLKNNDVQNAIIYAGDAIEALLAENAKLKAERDAALQFVKKNCYSCKHEPCPPMKPPCFGCKQNFSDGHSEFVNWEWRGVKEVNDVV